MGCGGGKAETLPPMVLVGFGNVFVVVLVKLPEHPPQGPDALRSECGGDGFIQVEAAGIGPWDCFTDRYGGVKFFDGSFAERNDRHRDSPCRMLGLNALLPYNYYIPAT
jgi:hypothetical protein